MTSPAASLAAIAGLGLAMSGMAAHAEASDPDCLGTTSEVQAAAVIDARSVQLEDGRVLRLAGIEPFGLRPDRAENAEAELKRNLEASLTGASLRIAVTDGRADRYGRLAALLSKDGIGLDQESLARAGVAIGFSTEEFIPCFDRILAAEDEARRAGRGFWHDEKLPSARPELLEPRIGEFAIFEGVALTVGNRRSRTYLNFGRRWSEDVTVEIDARDRARFGGDAGLAKLAGRRLRIRGFLERKGGPMALVRSPLQIETLDPASEGKTP